MNCRYNPAGTLPLLVHGRYLNQYVSQQDSQHTTGCLSLEAPNYSLCIQSNSAGFSFVNTGEQVHLKHARRHFERNLVKDVHHRSVAYRNWLKIEKQGDADLTLADFFLRGLLKGKVYTNTPRTIEQLKDAIRQEIQAVNFDT